MSHARDVAARIVRTLRGAGHEAYFAGGCVRDELLGLTPEDYDVATDARPERVRSLFQHVNEVGVSFGVMLVHMGGVVVEVATFREEGAYSDKRRPDSVTFATAEADARRRDFTINALFLDPTDTAARAGGRVIDFVGGQEDLGRRLIRAVGDPEARLAEDHLRALRGVRLASRLGFEIDGATEGAIARHASELRGVSRERVGEELRKMLGHASRGVAAARMQAMGLDGPALMEDRCAAEPRTVAGLPAGAAFATALAAWALDRGSSRVAERWRKALCLSNDERDALAAALRGVAALEDGWAGMGVAGRKRAAASAWFGPALSIVAVRRPGVAAEAARDALALAATRSGLAPAPLVNGDDLIAAGFAPGPRFREWLEAAYDAQLEERVSSPGEALDFVRRLRGGE